MIRPLSASACALALLVSPLNHAFGAEGLVINEFLAVNNTGYVDEDGAKSDWIEIYNGSASVADLTNLYLTDDAADLTKWRFPSVLLGAGQYLVVFASGQNRRVPGQPLHTSFALSKNGEYLALVDGDGFTVIHAYAPSFPEQLSNVSYGISTNDTHEPRYFAVPTPGLPNGSAYLGVVADTKFSADSGLYSAPVEVTISSATAGATIRYTLDSSAPTEVYGTIYTGPILIDKSTVVRAVAYKSGYRSTDVDTQSYIFLANVLSQPPNPSGFPATWGGGAAYYAMDQNTVNNPANKPLMTNALRSLPTVSLVTAKQNLFDNSYGIYVNGGAQGIDWERPATAEWIGTNGVTVFKADCGIRIQGGAGRGYIKHSFRVLFKSMYGPSKLDAELFDGPRCTTSFDTFILRAGWNDAFSGGTRQYFLDECTRRSQLAMGVPASHGTFVHLYIDGLYWGLYNAAEKPDQSFGATYFGGDKDNYDVVAIGEPIEGDLNAWNQLLSLCQSGTMTDELFERIQGNNPDRTRNPAYPDYLDVENYIDYVMSRQWMGDWDWPWNNWHAMRDRDDAASSGFKFAVWDAEGWSLGNNKVDRDSMNSGVGALYWYLFPNPEFKLLYADHIYRHYFNEGALTTNQMTLRYKELAAIVEPAIMAENARWGGSGYSLDNWRGERDSFLSQILWRSDMVLQQYRAAGLYPGIDPPVFSQRGGIFTNGFELAMASPHAVYYTLDNTDPREHGTGNMVGTLYDAPVSLACSAVVKARARSAEGEWSALNEAVFVAAAAPPLQVTEVMYNPRAPSGAETNGGFTADDFEFIELHNASSNRVGLAGTRFTDGITFDFTSGRVPVLEAGEYVLAVKNLQAFKMRYPQWAGLRIAGEYAGSLDDGGEQVTLKDGLDGDVFSFTYSDGRGWPLAADGAGHALVPLVFAGQEGGALDYGGSWRAGTFRDGSPGAEDPARPAGVLINEIVAHTDYTNALDSNDGIELFNAGTGAVSLAHWYVSDSSADLRKWAIPEALAIEAGGWIGFDEVTGFHNPATAGFGLSKSGDEVFLSYLPGTAEDRVVDCVRFKGQENERSLGRYPDGGLWWYAMGRTTNATGKANTPPVFEVVISEIMYHPRPTADNPGDNTDDEYIELRNITGGAVLFLAEGGAWRMDGEAKFVFPAGFSLPAGGRAVLVPFDPTNAAARTVFLNAYGLTNGEAQLLGPYAGKLSNHGGRIAIERPQNPDIAGEGISWVIVDEVIYFDRPPWPAEADGTGQPLCRRTNTMSGNDPGNWEAGFWSSPGIDPSMFRISVPGYAETVLLGSSVPVAAVFDGGAVSGSVGGVEFFADGASLGADTEPPYGCTLGPLTNERTYTLTARLTDGAGAHAARPVAVNVCTVNNAGGATEVDSAGGLLNGAISNNGSAGIRIYWGDADGGTNANAWGNAIDAGRCTGSFSAPVSGLLSNGRYYYRCCATNAFGALWASSSTSFVTRPPEVTLSIEGSPLFENGGTATVRASLGRRSAADVTVGLVFSGTALPGVDYLASSTNITIAAGQLSGVVTLTGRDDTEVEQAESVLAAIDWLNRGTAGTPSQAAASLISDDPRVQNTAATNVTDSTAVVGGILTHGYGSGISVYWGPADGGASKAGWASSSSVGTCPEGLFTASLAGLTANQTYYFRCYALNSGGEDWADTSLNFHTAPPSVSIDDASVLEGNAGTADAVFAVRLSAKSATDVSVRFSTSNGTAVAVADYAATQGTLIIPAGQARGEIVVPVLGDAEDEWPSERFVLNLGNPTNCTIADGQATGVIRDDDVAVTLAPWRYRMKISFPGYQRGETLRDFPALVAFNTNLANFAYAQLLSGGGQAQPWSSLRFANSNVTALLNYEVEQWDTNGLSHVWVQVPELTGTNAFIWAYWGNAQATNAPAFTTNGAAWSAGYKGVWHMGTVNARDATSLGHHGTAMGSVSHVASGVIGGANEFDANADYIAVPHSSDFALAGDCAISAWIYSDDVGNRDEGFVGTYNGSGFIFSLQNDPGNTLRLWSGDWRSSDAAIQDGKWTHVAYTREGAVARFYIDGACVRERSDPLALGDGGELHLGAAGTAWGDNRLDGKLDEVRISSSMRSSNWIWACWCNQASNGLFTSYAEVEAADTNAPSIFVVYGATNITDSSAYVTARLTSTGTAQTAVSAYWGGADGGQVPGNWSNSYSFGTVSTKPYIDYSRLVTGLQANAAYYYAYRAANSRGTNWASARFSAMGRPWVANAGVTNVGVGAVTLQGRLLNESSARVTVYWGPADGGSNKAAWAASASVGTVGAGAAFSADADGLLYGVRYYYRCYATNGYGEDWADEAASFVTAPPGAGALGVKDGLVLWLDAGDFDGDGNARNNPADGTAVSAWRDRSGFGHHAGNLDGAAPRCVAAGLNARPALRFEGNSFLYTSYDFDALAGYSIFSLARYTGGDSERVISSRTHNWLFGFWGNGDERWYAEGWVYSAGDGNTDWHLHAGTMTGDTDPAAGFWKDGRLLTSDNRGSHDTVYKPGQIGLGGAGANNEASRCEIAEVLIYNRVLSSNEMSAVGTYLTQKYGLDTEYSDKTTASEFGVVNDGASNVTSFSAQLTGTLSASGSVFNVWLHWGGGNAGTNGVWDQSVFMGSFTNVPSAALSLNVSGLTPETTYYYTFSASNAAGEMWAEASSFTTLADLRRWSMRSRLTFTGYSSGETLRGFPALVVLGTNIPGFAYTQFDAPGGRDLRFTDGDGQMLDYEVEAWNPRGDSLVWVRIPELDSTGADSILAYWGNRTAPRLPCTTNGSVWADGFKAVWHMAEPAARDSTGNAHNGTPQGALTTGAGVIGAGNDFRAGGYIQVPASSDWSFRTGDWTWSAWGFTSTGGDRGIMGDWNGNFIFAVLGGNHLSAALNNLGWRWEGQGVTVPQDSWHLLACARNGTVGRFYIDGVQVDSWDIGGGDANRGGYPLHIGRGGQDWGGMWNGLLDEVRIEDVGRSADWLLACYSNQLPGSSFVAYGEAVPFHGIANRPVSAATSTSAVFNALLNAAGTSYYVNVYWGPVDGATNAAAWAHTNSLGLFTDAGSTGLSYTATAGISEFGTNYYTWRVTNAAYSFWAQPSVTWGPEREWLGAAGDGRWSTAGNWLGDNAPDAAPEGAIFAGSGTGEVRLGGSSYTNASLTFSAGDYSLTDTNASPGSLKVGSLLNSGGANTIAVGMTVTGAAEVAGGRLTLSKTDGFRAEQLRLNGGALDVIGKVSLVNGLTEWWFEVGGGDQYLDPIDSGSGFLTMAPGATGVLDTRLAFDGSAMNARSGGLVGVDMIGTAWWGKLVVGAGSTLPAGTVTFATASDDGSVVWIDLDHNGRFEHAGLSGDEMIVNNKGWHGVQTSYGTVNLPAGMYDIAMGFYEGGGGESMEVRYAPGNLAGNWSGMTTVNPSAAGQSGLWQTGGMGPAAMTNTPVIVAADSSIRASSGTNVAALGALTVAGGATLTTAQGSPVGFAGTTIPFAAKAAGFNAGVDTYLTQAHGVDGSGAPATITKTGAGRLILDRAGSNLGDAAFLVLAGALAGVHADAFGTAALQLGGGELLLSSPGGNTAYANGVAVSADSTLTAGRAGNGVSGPLTNTLAGNIAFAGGQTLSMRSTDGCTLRVSGEIEGNGTNSVTAGSVIIDDTSFNAVVLNGGALTVYSNLAVNTLLQNGGAFTMAGASKDLTVLSALTLNGAMDFSGGPGLALSSAAVTLNSGASVTYDKPLNAGALTLGSGATLRLGTHALQVGTLTWRNGGALDGATPILFTKAMSLWPQCTIPNTLSGAGDLFIGDPEDGYGYVALTGTNDCSGRVQIRRAVLRADEGLGLSTNSLLAFRAAGRDQPCVLETRGSFTRSIGTAAGEVFWDETGMGGGFAARGGSLTVSLEGNAALDWSSPTQGFNNRDALILGSETADSMVELTNPIDLNNGSRWLNICNNPNGKTDFARLSGNVTGSGAWDSTQLRFNENSGNNFYNSLIELTGTNTYSQRTWIDYCTVYAVDGAGLPTNSLLYFEGNDVWEEAVLLSRGAFNRRIGHDQPGQVYWGGHGGFAARGGPLTVTLEDGEGLNWWDNGAGFNGQWLQLNSQYADSKVEIVNPINIGGDDRALRVFDNLDTDQDVAVLSGAISGFNHGAPFRKSGPGTLWLRGPNTFQQYLAIDWGAVRLDSQANLPAATTVTFVNWWMGGDWPKTIESRGTLELDVGQWNDAGKVSWQWGAGGFSAYGGPLSVNLAGGATLLWDTWDKGFDGKELHLGSHSADNVVTLVNTLDARGGWRVLRVWGNPYSPDDSAVVTNITSTGGGYNGHLAVSGDGTLKVAGSIDNMNYLRVEDNATLLINGSFTGNNVDSNNGRSGGSYSRYPGWGATPTLGGRGTITAGEVRLRGWSPTSYTTLAPGDGVGTLSATLTSGFVLESGTVTYEWELGAVAADKVAVAGNLWMGNGWRLKLLAAGGTPRPASQYNLFTYSGTCTYAAPALDFSAIPADWRTNNLQVVHDPAGKRIYLTGLYSVLSVANDAPTDLTSTSATLNGIVSAQGQALDVRAYWGPADQSTNAGLWANSVVVARVTNSLGQSVSCPITGLSTNAAYFYTFQATNGTMSLWAKPSMSFHALGPPVVTNTGASGLKQGAATLNGQFLDHNRAAVTFCWGRTDGGTGSPADWQYSANIGDQSDAAFSKAVTGLLYPLSYVYRVYASNAYGTAWSAASARFATPVPEAFRNGFEETIFDNAIGDAQNNIELFREAALIHGPRDGQGVLTTRLHYQDDAAVSARAAALGAMGFDNGDFAMLWITDFKPTESGAWGFRFDTVDDNVSFWIDTDGNGTFEGGNRWFSRGCCGSSGDTYTPSLTAGTTYKLGIVMNDTGGGGYLQNLQFKAPSGSWTSVSPSDPPQDGLWRIPIAAELALTNAPASSLSTRAATLNAVLTAEGWCFDVYAYYGRTNGLNMDGSWEAKVLAGTFTSWTGQLSVAVSNLAPNSQYYFTFSASNAVTNLWSVPVRQFFTLSDDADGDGLPDAWESTVFGGTNATSGGSNQDWDGDGASDRDEYIAGTQATNRDSSFRLDAFLSNGVMVLRCEGLAASGPGYEGLQRRYDLEQGTNLLTGPWLPVPGRTNLLGEGRAITHTNQASSGSFYYRGKVRLQ